MSETRTLDSGKVVETIRVCPERDGRCPHGLDCPYSIDRYQCDMEASRAALQNVVPNHKLTEGGE